MLSGISTKEIEVTENYYKNPNRKAYISSAGEEMSDFNKDNLIRVYAKHW